MDEHNRLEVITQYGWQKEYPLTKGIIHIGSAPTNDIILDERFGGGVAPLQVQLITIANGHTVYKLVNMGETDIVVGAEPEHRLTPHSVLDLTDGLQFRLGEFTLVFHSSNNSSHQAENHAGQSSRSIGLKLEMPSTQLMPHQSLEGIVIVSNLGHQMGARFDLTLEGLEPDCYDLAPGPLLSSGAEKEVFFRLYHRGHQPLAGSYHLVIRATAPETYPGEQATVTQNINVLPHYQHEFTLTPSKGITVHQPVEQPHSRSGSLNGTAITANPAPETAWDLPLKTRPLPAVTFIAGHPPPANNEEQPQHVPSEEAGNTWWLEEITANESTEPTAEVEQGTNPEPVPQATPAASNSSPESETSSSTSVDVLGEDEFDTELAREVKPAQQLEMVILPKTSSPVMKEEEEQWWGTS